MDGFVGMHHAKRSENKRSSLSNSMKDTRSSTIMRNPFASLVPRPHPHNIGEGVAHQSDCSISKHHQNHMIVMESAVYYNF